MKTVASTVGPHAVTQSPCVLTALLGAAVTKENSISPMRSFLLVSWETAKSLDKTWLRSMACPLMRLFHSELGNCGQSALLVRDALANLASRAKFSSNDCVVRSD